MLHLLTLSLVNTYINLSKYQITPALNMVDISSELFYKNPSVRKIIIVEKITLNGEGVEGITNCQDTCDILLSINPEIKHTFHHEMFHTIFNAMLITDAIKLMNTFEELNNYDYRDAWSDYTTCAVSAYATIEFEEDSAETYAEVFVPRKKSYSKCIIKKMKALSFISKQYKIKFFKFIQTYG